MWNGMHGNANFETFFSRQFITSGNFFRDKLSSFLISIDTRNAVYRFMWVIFTCIAIYGKCKSRIRIFFVSRSAEVRLRHKFTDWLQFPV